METEALTMEGTIIRALSGFYYVRCPDGVVPCRAKGRFRREGISPLVGDRVIVELNADNSGTVAEICPRKNSFARPSIANVDWLVMIVSEAIPVTDPFLADRVTVRCEKNRCGVALVINKCDLSSGDKLAAIYATSGYPIWRVSAATGEGIAELRAGLRGKICCFTGNSGVGKSSVLNALDASLAIPTAEVSRKLGRGKHTTRHVELFDLGDGTLIADTPGFASFGDETEEAIFPEELDALFPEFSAFRGECRFDDCTHRKEPGCRVREAVENGAVHPSRYQSYLRLHEEASKLKKWELK